MYPFILQFRIRSVLSVRGKDKDIKKEKNESP